MLFADVVHEESRQFGSHRRIVNVGFETHPLPYSPILLKYGSRNGSAIDRVRAVKIDAIVIGLYTPQQGTDEFVALNLEDIHTLDYTTTCFIWIPIFGNSVIRKEATVPGVSRRDFQENVGCRRHHTSRVYKLMVESDEEALISTPFVMNLLVGIILGCRGATTFHDEPRLEAANWS